MANADANVADHILFRQFTGYTHGMANSLRLGTAVTDNETAVNTEQRRYGGYAGFQEIEKAL